MTQLNDLILSAINFKKFIIIFNSFPVEITWILFLFFCFFSILFFLKIFGEIGLYIYTVIAIIAGNFQVLKIVKFSFFSEPVALGTILFASTFLCTDILAEYYGIEKARKNVLIGFIGFLLMTIISLFTLGFKPLTEELAIDNYAWALNNEKSLIGVFLPLPIFFLASMSAYLSRQYFDVWFFNFISKITHNKYLWLRNNLSTMVSSLLDNTVFSILAFVIFATEALPINTVIFTYILGTYILRILISLFDTPFVYIASHLIKK